MTEERDIGLPARRAAIDILSASLARRAGLDEALSRPLFKGLEQRDRGFAMALAMATLRRLGPIERALDAKLTRAPPEEVRNILRIGVTQAFLMDVPAFAAVTTSVDLAASHSSTRAFKGLINAVLRGLLREPPNLDLPEALCPPWLYARWTAAFGREAADAMAALIADEPATDLSLKSSDHAERLAAELEGEVLAGGTLRTPRKGDVAAWPAYDEGLWWVQDASAAIPARLLDAKPGETVLDFCAAPGGKTMQLAATGAEVIAVDRSPARLVRVKENLERTGLTVEVVAADAGEWADEREFDAVLLDAPCSATGTYRRHPDVLWAARPSDVAALASVQSRLLDSAAKRTKVGGRLVYCVCSLEPEEGEAQTAAFLMRHRDFKLSPAQPGEAGSPWASQLADGTLRLLPHHRVGGQDGFYVARFVRTG
ncbi:MAG: RsmB/NOP family class I SAM-dependent RNA methyltransferase [Phenylobacterium sp.]|uniref:RsmB/NOP family class I SAM-dependent RNA methyltransferase n=1 Tax=Phenylobacterium sp. TaxID=1871053 RepID=UPI002727CC2F|nr:RsmB/NOP family class I SAM-dependent RNA methyltransferase [Phenylobacterium sp.]MDO9431553.1 RsmB/NOP family class I SAM-dependent RNA methyltransferase [Phenylobacterium sp.]